MGKNTGRIPPYGILRYGEERIFQIDWDEDNQAVLMDSGFTDEEIAALARDGII